MKVLVGILLAIGALWGVFTLLVTLMSTHERAAIVSENVLMISIVIAVLWLAFGWGVESFGRGLAAGIVEGLLSYGTIRMLSSFVVDDYEWAQATADSWGSQSSVDPSMYVLAFMLMTIPSILLGIVILAMPEIDEIDDDDDNSGSGGSNDNTVVIAAVTAAVVATTII